jgi:hypothetical protein
MGSSAEARNADDLSALLGRYVAVGADGLHRVAYSAWRANRADLGALEEWIARAGHALPSRMPRAEAFAYWANLYNAITLRVVLAHPNVGSIREIRSRGVGLDPRGLLGPWREARIHVEGRHLSLDDIEHGIMRPRFRDPLVHYAVNCASVGCPNIPTQAWQADTLAQRLEAAARSYINSRRGVRVVSGTSIRVSSIYVWYQEDFGGSDAGVIAHLRRYASPSLLTVLTPNVRIVGHDYDWSLNDTPRG